MTVGDWCFVFLAVAFIGGIYLLAYEVRRLRERIDMPMEITFSDPLRMKVEKD